MKTTKEMNSQSMTCKELDMNELETVVGGLQLMRLTNPRRNPVVLFSAITKAISDAVNPNKKKAGVNQPVKAA